MVCEEIAVVALLGLGQGLEPVGDFFEALFARRARHTRVHIRVFVSLTGNRRLQVGRRIADRLAGRGIAHLFEELEVTVRVAGLALGSRAKDRGNVVVTLNIRLLRKVKIAAVGLAFASKRVFQVVLCIRSFESSHWCLPLDHSFGLRSCPGRQHDSGCGLSFLLDRDPDASCQ